MLKDHGRQTCGIVLGHPWGWPPTDHEVARTIGWRPGDISSALTTKLQAPDKPLVVLEHVFKVSAIYVMPIFTNKLVAMSSATMCSDAGSSSQQRGESVAAPPFRCIVPLFILLLSTSIVFIVRNSTGAFVWVVTF